MISPKHEIGHERKSPGEPAFGQPETGGASSRKESLRRVAAGKIMA
jgi:hypothetical protein